MPNGIWIGNDFTPAVALVGGAGTSASAPSYVQSAQPTTDYTDASGTVTAGGTAQNATAASTARKALIIANPSTTLGFYYSTTGAAGNGTAGGVYVAPGGAVIFTGSDLVPKGAVSIYGATTGQPFTVQIG